MKTRTGGGVVLRLIIGALAVAALTGLHLDSASARLGGADAKRPAPSPAATAKRLAGQVAGARTAATRRDAVLAVMRSVGIGVYTASGKRLVRGQDRSRSDFYLYDAEVRAI